MPSQTASRKRRRTGNDPESDESADESEEEKEARSPPNLHPDDPANFCKLSSAVKLLLSHPITDQQIDAADVLLRSYGPELITVRPLCFESDQHAHARHSYMVLM